MTGNPWARVHPRLQGVVAGGLTQPRDRRAARNAYWLLAHAGGIEPAGWGDLTFDDLDRIASVIGADEAFLPVHESAGLRLPGREPGPFDWLDDSAPIPGVQAIAEHVTWIVLGQQVTRVGSNPPGTGPAISSTFLAARLAALIARK